VHEERDSARSPGLHPDAVVGVYAAIDREGNVAVLVKETVDVVLDVLVVGFQWARRKD